MQQSSNPVKITLGDKLGVLFQSNPDLLKALDPNSNTKNFHIHPLKHLIFVEKKGIALNLIKMNFPGEQTAQATGVALEEVKNFKRTCNPQPQPHQSIF